MKNKNCSDEENVNSFDDSIYNTDYEVFFSSFSSQFQKQSLVIFNDENKLILTSDFQSVKCSYVDSI